MLGDNNMSQHNSQLKEAGLKITLPRLKILQIFEQSHARHLSAEEVYKALLEQGEEASIATVYRVLTQFESSGLLHRHNFEGGSAVFELSQGEHHDHLVCIRCGGVAEFCDPMVEERLLAIAAEFKFKIMEHALYIYGECESCC